MKYLKDYPQKSKDYSDAEMIEYIGMDFRPVRSCNLMERTKLEQLTGLSNSN